MKGPEKKLDEVTARAILYFYETKKALPSANSFNGGFNDYFAEQLMPKPGKEIVDRNWPYDPEEKDDRDTLVSSIGNYFLLEGVAGEIKKSHNMSLDVKKSSMTKWSSGITSSENMLKSIKKTWENKDIRTRGTQLCKKFSEDIWTL